MKENEQSTKYPAVSVIIPAYNTEKYIAECLDSLLAQTFKGFEAICIDDGSTDKSLSIFNEYAARDSRIKVLSQKNQGVVAARNNAIAAAHGEYIFPLDSDDILAPDCLKVLYDFIITHDYAIVAPGVQLFGALDETKIHWHPPKPTRYNMYAKMGGLPNSSMYAKKFWEKYGGYDHLFDKGLEDYDFWLNFLDDGLRAVRFPEESLCFYYYRIKAPEESRSSRADAIGVRDELLFRLRCKHPKIAMYRVLYKIITPLHKIFRFLVRWGKTYNCGFIVRICKITVYRRNAV